MSMRNEVRSFRYESYKNPAFAMVVGVISSNDKVTPPHFCEKRSQMTTSGSGTRTSWRTCWCHYLRLRWPPLCHLLFSEKVC